MSECGNRETSVSRHRRLLIVSTSTFLLLALAPGAARAADVDEGPAIGDWLTLVAFVAIVVMPLAGLISFSKGHRWPAYAGLFAWVLAWVGFLFPIGSLQDLGQSRSGFQDWIVDNFSTFQVVANVTATLGLVLVVVYALRLARPASPWAQSRYSGEKFRQSVERYGRLD